MKYRRLRTLPLRPWAVWLALCVALLGALAPTVSHALAWGQGSQPAYLDICTNAVPGAVPAADFPDSPQTDRTLTHCPFCLHASDRVAPPLHPVVTHFPESDGTPEGPVLRAVFYAPDYYSNAAPRGPPAFLSY